MSEHRSPEQDRAALRRPAAPAGPEADAGPAPHPLVALGRQVGNAAIGRMLAQRAAEPEEEELALSRDPALQREAAPDEEEELALSRDPALQREAAPDEDEELALSRDPALQREAAPDEEEELALSREGAPEVGPEGGPVSDGTAGKINSMRGGGSGLDDTTRAAMESHLGDDFSDVRVHTGAEAAQLNRSLGARAFTTGSDIFFGAGASPGDRGLLAHELTHVVQQRGMEPAGEMTVGAADDAHEVEAEAVASQVGSGARAAQRDEE